MYPLVLATKWLVASQVPGIWKRFCRHQWDDARLAAWSPRRGCKWTSRWTAPDFCSPTYYPKPNLTDRFRSWPIAICCNCSILKFMPVIQKVVLLLFRIPKNANSCQFLTKSQHPIEKHITQGFDSDKARLVLPPKLRSVRSCLHLQQPSAGGTPTSPCMMSMTCAWWEMVPWSMSWILRSKSWDSKNVRMLIQFPIWDF